MIHAVCSGPSEVIAQSMQWVPFLSGDDTLRRRHKDRYAA